MNYAFESRLLQRGCFTGPCFDRLVETQLIVESIQATYVMYKYIS